MSDKWKWKEQGGKSSGLLYSPGNWGDFLKLSWLVRVCPWLRASHDDFDVYDLFAGASNYSLPPFVRKNISRIEDPTFLSALSKYVDKDLWPSAATVANDFTDKKVHVCEQDEERRSSYGVSDFSVMEETCGWDALESLDNSAGAGLVIIDPYDFLDGWSEHLPAVINCSKSNNVLVYIYNRSPKSTERLRDYRKFRRALDDLLEDKKKLIGRVPADSFLPDAYHEMIFLPADASMSNPDLCRIFSELEAATLALAKVIEQGAYLER